MAILTMFGYMYGTCTFLFPTCSDQVQINLTRPAHSDRLFKVRPEYRTRNPESRLEEESDSLREKPPLVDTNMLELDSLRGSSIQIGTTQKILPWPLRKDEHMPESKPLTSRLLVRGLAVAGPPGLSATCSDPRAEGKRSPSIFQMTRSAGKAACWPQLDLGCRLLVCSA